MSSAWWSVLLQSSLGVVFNSKLAHLRFLLMSRHSLYIAKRRAELVRFLGGACVNCGETENLHCDCIKPQGHDHHRCGPYSRLKFYLSQLAVGNLQLLCERCHELKTRIDCRAGERSEPAGLVQ